MWWAFRFLARASTLVVISGMTAEGRFQESTVRQKSEGGLWSAGRKGWLR
jgi:hypothetical protein